MLLLSSNKGDAMALTSEQQQIVDKATLTRINGWQYLTVEGSPYEIGFEHGYLLTDEFKDAIRVYTHMTLETLGMDYSFFVDQAVKLHKDKIPQEYIEEMQGMADGFTAGGFETSLDDVIGWNDWMELTGYWWPQVAAEYSNNPPDGPKGSHCSGFVATGSATKDGKPVIAHESFDDFWSGQYFNVCESVKPAHGNSFKMQTVPGYIDSMTDFYVTSAGLAITETTIAGFVGYDVDGIPEFVRARKATQYANSIDEWVTIVNEQQRRLRQHLPARRRQHERDRPLRAGPQAPGAAAHEGRLVLWVQRLPQSAHSQPRMRRQRLQRHPPADRRPPRTLRTAAAAAARHHRRRCGQTNPCRQVRPISGLCQRKLAQHLRTLRR